MKFFFPILFFLHLQAFAQAPEKTSSSIEELSRLSIEELGQVTIISSIATGSKKPIYKAPAIVSVITAEEIKAMGANTLEEVLESMPGIHVAITDTYSVNYEMRGIATRFNPQVLIMINNLPLITINSNFKGEFVPLKMISRIEVIRGPGSALYGADAVAGVINIITKKSSDIDGSKVGVTVGSFKTREAWYLHGATYGDLNLTLMTDYQETRGHQEIITEDAQTRLDRLLGTKASLAPGPVHTGSKTLSLLAEIERSHWTLRGFYNDISNRGMGQGLADTLDSSGQYSFSRAIVDLIYHNPKLSEDWDFTSQLSYGYYAQQVDKQIKLFPPGANLGKGVFVDGVSGTPEYWMRKIYFDNSGFYTGIDKHRLRVGLGYTYTDLYKVAESRNFDPMTFTPLSDLKNESYGDGKFLPVISRSSYYSFIQDEWQFAKSWEFTGGVRYDRYSDFGDTVNPRAALVWKTFEKLSTKLLYGEAFRAPNFTDLYTKNNPVALGNSHLKPETIRVYELGFSYLINPKLTTNLNFFTYRVHNIIAFVRDANGVTATAQNFGVQDGNGFELESIFNPSSEFSFTGNYSFVKSTDKITGKPSGKYPAHQVYVGERWKFYQEWNWGINMNWIGERKRTPTDKRNPLSGYTKFNTTLARTGIFNKYDISVTVHNLFDADVRDPSEGPSLSATSAAIPHDLPKAGRSVDVSLAYNF